MLYDLEFASHPCSLSFIAGLWSVSTCFMYLVVSHAKNRFQGITNFALENYEKLVVEEIKFLFNVL